jgi:hypothetical protein
VCVSGAKKPEDDAGMSTLRLCLSAVGGAVAEAGLRCAGELRDIDS